MSDPALPPGFEEDPPPPPGFELDTGGTPAPATAPPPPPPRQVGPLESMLRTAGLVARSVVGVVDQAAAGLAGLAGDRTGQEDIFRNMDARQARMAEAYSPQEGEKFSMPGQIAGGLLMGGAGLMAAGSGAGGQERAREVIQRGGTLGQAANAGLVKGGVDAAMAVLPAKAGGMVGRAIESKVGGLLGGALTGGAIAGAAGSAARKAENAALPEGDQFRDLQQPVAPTGAEVGLGAAFGAVPGAAAAGNTAVRALNASRAAATEAKAAKQAALEAPKQAGRQAAREAGYMLTPTEAGAGKTARTTEGLSGEPRLAKAASEKNAEVTNALIRKDVQLPDDVPLSREALASKRREAGAAYAAIKDVGDIKNDAQYMAALDKVAEGYDTAAKSFPHRSENPFKKTLEGLKQETVSASSAIEEVKLLRNDADKAFRNGDKALGKAYRDAANALDDSIDRHLTRLAASNKRPELASAVQKYRDARRLIAKTYVADKAVNDTTGNINAAVYARELKRGTKLDGNALTVAKFAQQFPRLAQPVEKVGNTGATIADAALGLLGKEALLLGARPLARKALLSETVQNRMVPKRKPQAPPPEPPLTAEQSPFPPQSGPEGPASPLGDLTPDWETAPGAAAPAGRTEVVPAEGLVPAVDEAPGPSRVLPGGADLRPRSAESPAGPVQPGPVAEPPTPSRRAGEQIPAVPGRPDLPDTMTAEGPGGITPSAPGDPRAPDASYANRVQQGLEKPGGFADEPIPVGEATEMLPTDPRLAELEQLRESAKSETVKKALAAEAAKLKRELKAQAEAEKLKADVAELRQAAGNVKDQKLKERLLARADDLEKAEKLPVGEVTEGQPEIKPEKGERTAKPIPVGEATEIPVGEATEIPNEPATGRAPEMEKLPAGEATHVTDSGVEEAIPTGEVKELFVPPEKTGTAEVTLTEAKGGKFQGTDTKGDPYDIGVTERKMGAENPERSLLVEAHDPVSGQRRGFAEFVFDKDGKLTEQNVKIAPYLKKRNIEEILRRAVKAKGHKLETPPASQSSSTKTEGGGSTLPEGVTIRELKGGDGFEALNAQGNRVGYLKDNLKAGQAEQLGENANVSMVKVDKAFTGKGVGRALYQAFEKKHGGRIMPSGKTEPSAWKVWKRNYPEKVDAFVEQEVARVRDGAEAPLVVRNITDPEVRARVAAGIDKLKKPKP